MKLFTPTPLQWSDPYQIDSITAQQYGGDYDLYIPEYLYSEESYSAQQYRVVATSLICTQTPPVVPSQTPTPTPTPAGTPTVLSVEFQSTATSNVTNDNPANLGGGQRIFPDRQTPQDNENRRTVRVRAQLGDSGGVPANTSGVRVYFRNFDVDDPSNDSIIDPGGNAGNDNNGTFNGSRAGQLFPLG